MKQTIYFSFVITSAQEEFFKFQIYSNQLFSLIPLKLMPLNTQLTNEKDFLKKKLPQLTNEKDFLIFF